MSNLVATRSFEPITNDDLPRFGDVAWKRLLQVFEHAPVASLYKDRLLLLALAQGGALHYENGKNGLKDIDVWAFFAAGPEKPFPARARWTADYGPSKFGRDPDDHGFNGRRMDILGRSVQVMPGDRPEDSVRRWLNGRTASAIELRKKPMVIISPVANLGRWL
ncbi:hypothetical protein QD460_17835 [Rhizobium jaguaris]|uniref:Uncharacterized protein n=1 Tax=Rhizobium jaguaris TaxID=1312183 RepID=A0A387FP37_9HYPH|nr:hypothetical protein [Rhizobium jaguaris]AYG60279.1 hypothetical protein CCGE525_16745 [Rhizobium jaguaris]